MSPAQNRNPAHRPLLRSRAAKAALLIGCLGVACCTPPAPEPTPPPPSQPVQPAPAPPPPPPAPVYENWLDAPQTPGDWSYTDGAGLSYALFGPAGEAARLGLECRKTDRTVRIVRAGNAASELPMRIRTETADRMLTATPSPDGRPMIIATLQASDRLLDAMAFSRGRFAVETSGLETLYVPAWAEVTRVIEDCR
ncbi:hypothetical protein [Altererythrobacter sp. MTPC7]|uniref:hypothetical protein n=1 Tax=Altererythrobacter sp. MTPC7 TaxID=3056567 RepID=UPI0036F2F521